MSDILKYFEDKIIETIVFVFMLFISTAKAIKLTGEDKIKSKALKISSFMFSIIAGIFGWFLAKYNSDSPWLLAIVVTMSTWKGESMMITFSEAFESKFNDFMDLKDKNDENNENKKE